MIIFQTENLRVERTTAETAQLWLDVAGRSVNVLSRQVLADLDAALDRVASEAGLHNLIISSAKSGFLAGADVHEFAGVRSPEEATELSAAGQRLFDKLANLSLTTVAAIHGVCLGGGLELALACDYRQAIDHPQTQFGFPEIELGLVPGWGGTQRLPRLVGLEHALDMILTARRIDAGQALRWGLLDEIAARRPLGRAEAARFGCGDKPEVVEFSQLTGKRPKRSWLRRTLREQLVDTTPIGRWFVFQVAEQRLRRRVPEDMPAPLEALQAIRVGLSHGLEAGLAYEREAIGRLVKTTACRNLVSLFFQRDKARTPAVETRCSLVVPEIRRLGVVGAGTMGAGIAQLAALKGFEVVVQEVNEAALVAGMHKIESLFRKAAQRGLLTADEAAAKLAALRQTTTWEGFDAVDLAIEAVIEDAEAKRTVFRALEQRTRPGALLATNTSSLSVGLLQEGLARPERVAGLHFFNPVHKMPLVEVIAAPHTAAGAAARLADWTLTLGKTPVVVKDGPGFLVNRILIPYLNEAATLLAEGIPAERIDRTMRRFGMPIGPLELLDQVGLDVAAHIARALRPAFGTRFAASPIFERMGAKGWLGQKSGTGFYRYQGDTKTANGEILTLVREGMSTEATAMAARLTDAQVQEARDRMVLLMVNEAAACAAEAMAADAATIDLAMVLGTGWAPHRDGPLRYAQDRGLGEVVRTLTGLAVEFGPRFDPCTELQRRMTEAEPFYKQQDAGSRMELPASGTDVPASGEPPRQRG